MLHSSKTWAPSVPILQRLQRNDCSMIRWICGTKPCNRTHSSNLLSKLGVFDFTYVLWSRRLRWYGHVQRAASYNKTVSKLLLPGDRPCDRPAKTWENCVQDDIRECQLSIVDLMKR